MSDEEIRELLSGCKRIAVVGLSPVETRPSHYVARYLEEQGYHIFPVNPFVGRVLGRRSYPTVRDVPGGVDILAVYRRSEAVPRYAREALWVRPRCFWMPPGAECDEAERILKPKGIAVVSGRCLMAEHKRLAA